MQADVCVHHIITFTHTCTSSHHYMYVYTCTHYRYVLDLHPPDVQLRMKLWAKLIPRRAPVSTGLDFVGLAERQVCVYVCVCACVYVCTCMCVCVCGCVKQW